MERFQFASVSEAAKIKTEIQKAREEKNHLSKEKTKENVTKDGKPVPEKDRPDKSQEDKLMEELLGDPVRKEKKQQNPSLAETEKSHQSEPTSEKHRITAEGTSKFYTTGTPKKYSVREELKEIQATRKKEAEKTRQDIVSKGVKPKNQRQIQHKQPQIRKKTRKVKER